MYDGFHYTGAGKYIHFVYWLRDRGKIFIVFICFMFCCMLLYVRSSIAIILMGKRELVALLNLSSWCLVMVERLFLAVPRGCLQFVIVVFPDHIHYFCMRQLYYTLHIERYMRRFVVPGKKLASGTVFESIPAEQSISRRSDVSLLMV